jgi:SAM-dependent methyltransferase
MIDRQNDAPWSTTSWRERAGAAWLSQADRLEAMLEPVLEPLFQRADLRPGQQVLDVGCGRGVTSRIAANQVGPSGAVTGVDVSAELIDSARTATSADNTAGGGGAPIEWLVADAQRADFQTASFDAVLSRFGVMFFDDPVEAFTNLHRAVRPGGRLTIATWQPRDACDFQRVGAQAIAQALSAEGYEVPEADPAAGPYAFGVADFVESTLTDSGWSHVAVQPVDLPLYFGGPGASPQEAADMAFETAGMQSFLAGFDQRASELAAAALLKAFDAHHDGSGVRLDASILVTQATA